MGHRIAAPVLCLLAALALSSPAARATTLIDPGQGPVALAAGAAGASMLSGLAWAGGNQYYAVSDGSAALFELEIAVDPATGQISSASVVDSLGLAAGSDLEGLVLLGASVLASDEVGPAIREYLISDGSVAGGVAVPAIFAQARTNFSLESLAMRVAPDPADDALWTANEEALTVDGPLSDSTSGTVVRMQRFDTSGTPDGQWAYVTDPYPGAPFFGLERSGVADLLALPKGELLVLERSFSNQAFRARIYEVSFDGATDTTLLADLTTDPFTPVAKQLLWEVAQVTHNYEGLALGPQLAAGDRSLVLVSDDGGGAPQSLYALRLIPEPAATLQLSAGALVLWLTHRRRSRR